MKKDLGRKQTPAARGLTAGARPSLGADCGVCPKNHGPARSIDPALVKQHLGMMVHNAGRASRRPVTLAGPKFKDGGRS
jgi:hypothetical protein